MTNPKPPGIQLPVNMCLVPDCPFRAHYPLLHHATLRVCHEHFGMIKTKKSLNYPLGNNARDEIKYTRAGKPQPGEVAKYFTKYGGGELKYQEYVRRTGYTL